MQKLRKHFSAQFVNLVAKSDRLVSDIEKLRKWGFKILPGKFGCGGDADIDRKTIRVGRCKLICRMYILAHEIGHVLNSRDKSFKKRSPHRSSVEQYVFSEIRDEYRAIVYAIEILREIYADRPREQHHFNEWSKLAKAGKWAQLLKEIRQSVVTVETGKKFSDYWADAYKKEKRSAARKRSQTRKKNNQSKTRM